MMVHRSFLLTSIIRIICCILQKMKNPFEALKTHLHKDAKNGSRSAILFAHIALFTATIIFCKTRLYAEHDRTGCKTALAYQIITLLVSNSSRLNGLGFIRRMCGDKVNLIATIIWFILGILSEKFYEKSLSSLGFALSITVLILILLVIIGPSTDLGLLDFLIGVVGSVALDLFGLKFQIWIVVAICILLLVFRFWLESLPLDRSRLKSLPLHRSTGVTNQISITVDVIWALARRGLKSLPLHRSTRGTNIEAPDTLHRSTGGTNQNSNIIEELMVGTFHLFWVYNLFITNCGPKCNPSSVMEMLTLIFPCVYLLALIFPGVYSCCLIFAPEGAWFVTWFATMVVTLIELLQELIFPCVYMLALIFPCVYSSCLFFVPKRPWFVMMVVMRIMLLRALIYPGVYSSCLFSVPKRPSMMVVMLTMLLAV